MGGEIPSVEVSGLTGRGLDELVETISLLAELQDIRAETDGPAHGYVLESKVVKGLGFVFSPYNVRRPQLISIIQKYSDCIAPPRNAHPFFPHN